MYLNEDQEKISNLWAEIQPPLNKQNFGATLNPEMLTDLLAGSPNQEYLDIFTKRKFYDQALTRYHTQPQDILTKQTEPQPVELSFLADLYAGFNGKQMTSQQFHELNDQLTNFPAQSLARKIKKDESKFITENTFRFEHT